MPHIQMSESLQKSLFPGGVVHPEFKPGDTVKVSVKIREGGVERTQPFEGIVIRKHGGGFDKTFTVRKISFGIGIERIFPYNSPYIEKVEVLKKGSVRRAKLYYLRNVIGKAAKIEEETPSVTQKETGVTK